MRRATRRNQSWMRSSAPCKRRSRTRPWSAASPELQRMTPVEEERATPAALEHLLKTTKSISGGGMIKGLRALLRSGGLLCTARRFPDGPQTQARPKGEILIDEKNKTQRPTVLHAPARSIPDASSSWIAQAVKYPIKRQSGEHRRTPLTADQDRRPSHIPRPSMV